MGVVTRFGVVVRPETTPEGVVAAVRDAAAGGLHDVWFWEDCFFAGGIATVASALARSDVERVGLGLMPVPLRNPALVAMEIAGLARIFPGRFAPGVGHGVLSWMDQVGARAESEIRLLDEYVPAVRRLLHGETVTTEGVDVRLDEVRLDHPPSVAPPLLVGARGPKTLAVAARHADGVILDAGTTPNSTRAALETIEQVRSEAGRAADPFEVVLFLPAAPAALAHNAESVAAEAAERGYGDRTDAVATGDLSGFVSIVERFVASGVTTIAFQPGPSTDPEPFVGAIAELFPSLERAASGPAVGPTTS